MATVVRAELKWLHSVIADLRSGSLGFPSKAEMLRLAATMGGPSEEAISRIETESAASATQKRGRRRESSKQRPAKAKKTKRRRS